MSTNCTMCDVINNKVYNSEAKGAGSPDAFSPNLTWNVNYLYKTGFEETEELNSMPYIETL